MARWNEGLTPDEATYIGNMRGARNPAWEGTADRLRRQHEADAARAQAQERGYGGKYSQTQSEQAAQRGEEFEPGESDVSKHEEAQGATAIVATITYRGKSHTTTAPMGEGDGDAIAELIEQGDYGGANDYAMGIVENWGAPSDLVSSVSYV